MVYKIEQTTCKTWTLTKETETDIEEYFLSRTDKGTLICSCVFYSLRGMPCKHRDMLLDYLLTGKDVFE